VGAPVLPWRRVTVDVLAPTTLSYAAQGAVLPALVVTAQQLGASPGAAAAVAAGFGVGQILGSAPAGVLASRFGDRPVLVAASLLTAACWVLALVAPTVVVLGGAAVVAGAGSAAFNVARQSYVVDAVPRELLGRVMSTLGGVGRIGLLAGSLLAAGAQVPLGARGAYVAGAVTAALAGLLVLVSAPGRRTSGASEDPATRPAPRMSLLAVARVHGRVLLTLGAAASLISSARALRPVLLPLWGVSVGLAPEVVSLLFGLTVAVELLLFYPAGSVMDRWGRFWVAVPCAVLMGVAMLAFALAPSAAGLLVAAVLLGIGSGLGTGVVKTLGADAAPPAERGPFLGLWVLVTDVGGSSGPLLAAGLSAAFSLVAASAALGVVTLGGAAWLAVLLRGQAGSGTPPGSPPGSSGVGSMGGGGRGSGASGSSSPGSSGTGSSGSMSGSGSGSGETMGAVNQRPGVVE
jgi:MFS family permease